MARSTKSRAKAAKEERPLPNMPNELLDMIFKLAIKPSNSDEKFFWIMRGDGSDGSHLVEPKTPVCLDWGYLAKLGTVKCSKHKLRTQHKTYASIRGDTIRNFQLVSKSVERLVEREYVFLMPYQLVPYTYFSTPGFWVHPEHDIFQLLGERSPWPIKPSPSSAFPWSRVQNVHVSHGFHTSPFVVSRADVTEGTVYPMPFWGAGVLEGYQEIYSYTPNLKTIFINLRQSMGGGIGNSGGDLRPVPVCIAKYYMSTEEEAARKGKWGSLVAANCFSLPPHDHERLLNPAYKQTLGWGRSHGIEILDVDMWHQGFKSGYICQSVI